MHYSLCAAEGANCSLLTLLLALARTHFDSCSFDRVCSYMCTQREQEQQQLQQPNIQGNCAHMVVHTCDTTGLITLP